MLSRKNQKAQSQSARRPSREEIIALSLGCMNESAEKLAALAQKSDVFAACRRSADGYPEKS